MTTNRTDTNMHANPEHLVAGALLALLPTATGCSALHAARARVEHVRGVDLSGARVVTWRGPADVERATRGQAELLSFPFVRRVLAAKRPLLERLGVLGGEPDDAIAELAGPDPAWAAAFVVPEEQVILVRPPYLRDEGLLAHELGHLASWRAGYWSLGARHVPLDPTRPRDPAFVDLDALIAAWALEEGVAEATARAARGTARSAETGLELERERAAALRPLYPPPVIEGPSRVEFNGRLFVVPAGERRLVLPTLPERLREFAYGAGLRYVSMQGDPELGLEGSFARTWAEFGGTTREVLRGRPGAPSELARAFRERGRGLEPAPESASRVGSLLVLSALARDGVVEFERALTLALALEDDLTLGWAGDRRLWITRWESAGAAGEFAALARRAWDDAAVAHQERVVRLDWSAPTDAGSLLER